MSHERIWDEAALLALPAGESTTLEFKGSPILDRLRTPVEKLRMMLSKQISGFANYEGGLLLIGMGDPKPGQLAQCDGGVPLIIKGRQTTREWLEDLIPLLVDPKLQHFDVHLIAGDGRGQIPADRGVIVIEIHPSRDAPHQARDGRYYGRIAGTTQPLGHRMVMDIIGRQVHPQVELGGFFFERKTSVTDDGIPVEDIRRIRFACANTGRVVAKSITGALYLPPSFAVEPFREGFKTTVKGETVWVLPFSNLTNRPRAVPMSVTLFPTTGLNSHNPHFSYFEPLLPGTKIDLGVAARRITPLETCVEEIGWEVYADGAPVNEGRIRLADVEQRDIGTITRTGADELESAPDEPAGGP
jgi:hypothetical protein